MSTQLLWGDPAVTGDTELTIGIPSYRRTRTLREAIDSVLALPRDKVKFQLIISEDESDRHEEIRQIVESYGDPRIVYYYNTPALGMNENWTQCARLAKTKYIALLHDDDYLKPNYLDVVDNLLHRSPVHFDVVSFNHDILQDADGIIRPRPDDKGLYGKLQKNRFRRHTPGDFYFGALQCLLMPSCGIHFYRESLLGGGGLQEGIRVSV